MKWVFLFLFMALAAAMIFAKNGFASYQEVKDAVGRLYEEARYEEAEPVFLDAYDAFPKYRENITLNLLILYGHLERQDDGLRFWKKALGDGIWVYTYEKAAWLARYAGKPGFEAVYEKNRAMKQSADKDSRWESKVALPEGFKKGESYNVFIALHGGVSTIAEFEPHWSSPLMKRDFVTLYVQTSQHAGMNTFTWDDRKKGAEEVSAAYRRMMKEYDFKAARVLAGGFSAGATQALHMIMEGSIPGLAGFVFLAPQIPDNFQEPGLSAMAAEAIRGRIITGEKDHHFDLQETMHAEFAKYGVQHEYIIKKGMFHLYPEDLPRLIDEGIEYILGK